MDGSWTASPLFLPPTRTPWHLPSLMLHHHLSTPWPSAQGHIWQCLFSPPLQTYKDSDIDVFTFGTPINTISLATILLHQAMEMKTWVSTAEPFWPKNCVPVYWPYSYFWFPGCFTCIVGPPVFHLYKEKEAKKIKFLASTCVPSSQHDKTKTYKYSLLPK